MRPASPRAAAAPECPVRPAYRKMEHALSVLLEALEDEAPELEQQQAYRALSDARLHLARAMIAAPCPLAPEPSEAAVKAGWRESLEHCSRMEGPMSGPLRCICECGAVFDDKPESDADNQQHKHWMEVVLRAAYRAQFGAPAGEEEKNHPLVFAVAVVTFAFSALLAAFTVQADQPVKVHLYPTFWILLCCAALCVAVFAL